jgi:hypothetical protein
MRAGRQAVIPDRILEATTLEEVFTGPGKERVAACRVLAAVAAGRSRARRLAVVKGIDRGGAEGISLLTTCFKLARENNWLGCREEWWVVRGWVGPSARRCIARHF